jgi:hypothetical protein
LESNPVTNQNDPIPFRIELDNGVTITGKLSEQAFAQIIRDPSNLSSVVHDVPAGSAVSIVLPPSIIRELSVGDFV